MKRFPLARTLSVGLLFFALVGCGNNAPINPPPSEPTPPTTPPTIPIDPPDTPPTTPPVTPEPPVTPTPPTTPVDPPSADVPYGGGWTWVVVFEDETAVGGALAITQVESEPVLFTDSGEGPYFQCQDSCPEQADGLGIIGTYIAEDGSASLTTAFIDPDLESLRLVAFDADNQLGTELDGQESFLGAGQWTNDDGTTASVAVGIGRIPEDGSAGSARQELRRLLEARKDTFQHLDPARLEGIN